MEKELRKRNIIIQGIQDEEKEPESKLKEVRTVIRDMGIDIDIEKEVEDSRRLPRKKTSQGKNRPVLLEFGSLKKKMEHTWLMKSSLPLGELWTAKQLVEEEIETNNMENESEKDGEDKEAQKKRQGSTDD
ncbi:hypothetical protein FQA39_LY09267 [Lamprigera yunnana]|nr:hypothetical protein FQA39_LY09267 [Lamprigera yunnana]